MKLLTPKDRPVFTPQDQLGRPDDVRVSYAFRVPTVADQARLDHAIRKAGGRTWSLPQILSAMADAVRALLPEKEDETRVSVLAEIQSIFDAIIAASREVSAHGEAGGDLQERAELFVALAEALGNPRIEELRTMLAPSYPRLESMLADNEVYPLISGTEATRLFLADWTGLGEKPKRGLNGLAEDSLRRIPKEHRLDIGGFVQTLLAPTEDEEKNFVPPSGGESAGTASTAANTTVPATPSTATPGSPTNSASS